MNLVRCAGPHSRCCEFSVPQKINQKEYQKICLKEVQQECQRKDVRKNVQKYIRKKWGELEGMENIIYNI